MSKELSWFEKEEQETVKWEDMTKEEQEQMLDHFSDEIKWNKDCNSFYMKLKDIPLSEETLNEFEWIMKRARYYD